MVGHTCGILALRCSSLVTPWALARSCRRVESASRISCLLAWIISGGRPRRSANSGDASGVSVGLPARYSAAASGSECGLNITSASARVFIVSPEHDRSLQGEKRMAPAGRGRPWSREATRQARVRPPPAESPANSTLFGSTPCLSSSDHQATASSTAAGQTCSGALRVGHAEPLGGAQLVLGAGGHRLVLDVARRRRVALGHLVDHVPRLVHVQLAAALAFELVTQDEVGDEGLDAHARSAWYCLSLKRRVLRR